MAKKKDKKVTVSKGVKVARGTEEKMRKGAGKSSAGKYKNVKPKDFAGPDYTYPINDIAHARNALSRKHFSDNPAAIEAAVYAKYPQLKKRAQKRKKHEKKD